MRAELNISCEACGRVLAKVTMDTADMPEELQQKVNKVVLAHRQNCKYYRTQ